MAFTCQLRRPNFALQLNQDFQNFQGLKYAIMTVIDECYQIKEPFKTLFASSKNGPEQLIKFWRTKKKIVDILGVAVCGCRIQAATQIYKTG